MMQARYKPPYTPLQALQHGAFEVAGLGDREDLRVVEGLAAPLAHPHRAPGVGSGGPQGLLHSLARKLVGAGAGDEHTAAFEKFHGMEVYLPVGVGADRAREFPLSLGKGGCKTEWIQDNGIVPLSPIGPLPQEIEGVSPREGDVREAVQLGVGAGGFESLAT
jgi:hypothetical protein